MSSVFSRLVLLLSLGVSLGIGQLIVCMTASPVPLAATGALVQPTASASLPKSSAPVGLGWG